MGKPWSNTLELKANFLDDDDDPDDDDVPFGYGGSAAVSHIQDECMAHEEDMLAFDGTTPDGEARTRTTTVSRRTVAFSRRALACLMHRTLPADPRYTLFTTTC